MHLASPIGILGFGVEGKSTLRWLLKNGATSIHVFDRQAPADLPAGVHYAGSGETYLAGLETMATVFRTAGIRPDLPELAAAAAKGCKITSQIETAIEVIGRDRVIGVTGTLGKGTTCSLLEAMLDAAGIPCVLGGNIGTAALDAIETLPEKALLILELSSFQLSSLKVSPARAAILRTTIEHLDWHVSRREYWEHKANLVRHQKPGDFTVWCADVEGSRFIASQSPARKRSYGSEGGLWIREGMLDFVREGRKLAASECAIPGSFNLENIAAAAALALDCGASLDAVLGAARAFKGLEHRLEFVREFDGIGYYNDSYATRPDATQGAISALSQSPLGLILGGSDKGVDFAYLARVITASPHIRAIALIGETAEKIGAALQAASATPTLKYCQALPDSLAFLREQLGKEGNIALSPACASFGLFANYKERGKIFKKLVQELA
jgi:UDP-N-acetylmuramoylalanine--D-glutamate ligase